MDTITGTPSADTISPSTIIGGATGGSVTGGDDSILGLGGNDSIDAGAGNDTIDGGDNDDVLVGGAGDDSLIGGAGLDAAVYFSSPTGIVANLTTGLVSDGFGNTDRLSGIERIWASGGNDSIIGSSTAAGIGTYALFGGAGSDTIDGLGFIWNLVDHFGDSGAVRINLSSSALTLGGTLVDAGTGRENSGAIDTYINVLSATGSNSGDDFLQGGTAAEFLNGNGGHDSIDGGDGNDTLSGSAGNDTLSGSAGADLLQPGAGNDSIDGGADFDRISYNNAGVGPVTITFTANAAGTVTKFGAETDSFVNVEQIEATGVNDSLIGFAGATTFQYLRGMAGNDTIDGGNSNFVVADYSYTGSAITIDLVASTVSSTVANNPVGTDTLINVRAILGSTSNDTVKGVATGNFGLTGGGGNDLLDYRLMAGPISLSGTTNFGATAPAFAGVVTKSGGVDSFAGFRGVYGTSAGDSLVGAAETTGQNTFVMRGEGGNDTIDGRGGFNYVDYFDSTGGVTVQLQTTTLPGGVWQGTAADGLGGTDTLLSLRRIRGSDNGNDSITGTDLGDVFIATKGNDSYNGSAANLSYTNFNSLDYNGLFRDGFTGPITVTFQGMAAGLFGYAYGTVSKPGGQTDSFVDVNQVNGSGGADVLMGFASNAYAWNGATMRGNGGNDTIYGYATANNRADYANATNALVIDLQVSVDGLGRRIGSAVDAAGFTTNGTDTLIDLLSVQGTNFNDTMRGSDLSDTFVVGASGQHDVNGRGGANEIRYIGADSVTIDLGLVASGDGFGGYVGNITKTAGIDTLANIANVQGGFGNDSIYGTPDDNVMSGGSGSNLIDGRDGYDTLTYRPFTGIGAPLVGAVIDLKNGVLGIATNAYGGTDTLQNIEAARGTQLADDITGAKIAGGLVSYIRGDGGNDTLRAATINTRVTADYLSSLSGIVVDLKNQITLDDGWFGGQDTLVKIQAVRGSNFDDNILGGSAADTLSGQGGDDILDGGAGGDSLVGGTGNDFYAVNVAGDSISELLNEGMDTVSASVSWTLGENLEALLLTGAATTGTGNALDNTITGTKSANTLSGDAGNDVLYGEDLALTTGGNDTLRGDAGADTLFGGLGADQLDGGAGADSMVGGANADIYFVDDAGDLILELANGGIDEVRSTIDYTLGAELENLTLLAGAVNGSGNGLNNRIAGNGADNFLQGLAGADLLLGAGGADTLLGGNGADTLEGGPGRDSLDGGSQADLFRWQLATQGNDTIAGFTSGADRLGFSAAGFGGGLVEGVGLTAAQFQSGTTTAAGTADVRFIYNSNTGVLYFDADGKGDIAAVKMVTFVGATTVAIGDFVIIA